MVTYSNILRHDRLPFDRYLRLPGLSHSFLKYEQNGIVPFKEITDKMRLGSLVDDILTSPDKVNPADSLFPVARKCASGVMKEFGPIIKRFQSQVSYYATVHHAGLTMEVCGRLDWLLPGYADIDLKCTSAKSDKEFASLIKNMGYDNQQWNYAKMAQVPEIYILPYSTTLGRCLTLVRIPVTETNKFWEQKIELHGTATKSVI